MEITQEKREILDRALATPNDANSQIIIRKAQERGWLPTQDQAKDPEMVNKRGLLKNVGRHALGVGYGVVEAVNPLNIPKGLEVIGRAALTERGGLSERLQKASDRSVIPGQEEIGAAVRSIIPKDGKSLKERYRQELEYQGELLPDAVSSEGRLLGNVATVIYGLTKLGMGLARNIKALKSARKTDALSDVPAAVDDVPAAVDSPEVAQIKRNSPEFKAASKSDEVVEAERIYQFIDDLAPDSIPERVVVAPKAPKPTKADKAAAISRAETAPQATADDVAYYRAYRDRIEKGPSLNENAPNAMSVKVADDFEKFTKYINKLESEAASMIGDSSFSMTTDDIASIFTKRIKELESGGGRFADTTIRAVNQLKKYVKRLTEKPAILSPKEVRNFMQALWKDNKAVFVPGRDASPTELAVDKVTKTLNQVLKKAIGGKFAEHMKKYSTNMRAWSELRKQWKVKDGIPQAPGWFKNRFVYHMQELEAGNRSTLDPMVQAIDRMGKAVGENYPMLVKDELVFGRLFPDRAKGLQSGTASALWTRAAKTALSPREAVKGLAKKLIERSGERHLKK